MRITTVVKHVLPRRMRPFAHRLHVAVRRRLAEPPSCYRPTVEFANVWVPPRGAAAFGVPLRRTMRLATFFETSDRNAWKDAWAALDPGRGRAIIEAADGAVAHRFDLLGSGPVDLGPSIDWHQDFKSGARWALDPVAQVPTVLTPAGSDIKVPWELSRFYHAPLLGVAYLLTDDNAYAQCFAAQVGDWIERNPLGRGPNWKCGMEVAIRAANWLVALPYVQPAAAITDQFVKMFLTSVFEHGRYVRENLEGTASLRSNHYLSDLMGLLYIGLQFPAVEEAQEWVKFATGEIEREMEWEVYPDGTDFEASTAYHRLCLELFLGSALMCRNNDVQLSTAFWSRLEAMFLAVRALADGRGCVPLIGDNDSGRLHCVLPRADEDLTGLLPVGAALFENPRLRLPGVPFSEEALLMLGPRGRDAYERIDGAEWPDRSAALPDSGWYVLRRGEQCLHVSCGPNGQRFRDPEPGTPKWNGGHAHNDKLSITYSIGRTPVLVDPGQGCYTSDQARRNHDRATAAHNVLQVDGLEQQTLRSDYLFNIHDERARPCVSRWAPDDPAHGPWFIGEHEGYRAGRGVICRRSIGPAEHDGFDVVDTIEPAGDGRGVRPGEMRLVLHFHAAPGLRIGAVSRACWRVGAAAEIAFDPALVADARVDRGWVAPAYGRRVEADVLRVIVRAAPPVDVRWTIRPRPEEAEAHPAPDLGPTHVSCDDEREHVTDADGAANVLAATAAALREVRPLPPVAESTRPAGRATPVTQGPVLYTRLDYWNHAVIGGGSLGHTAHVVRGLDAIGVPVTVATGFYMPMLDPACIPTSILPGPNPVDFTVDSELQFFAANAVMRDAYGRLADRVRPALIYERPVVGNFVAAETAQRLRIPYVAEYNGSEIWVKRHWANHPFRYEQQMIDVEQGVLAAADLVVVVSSPLRDELIERGIDPARILVNPNGVDPDAFERSVHAAEAAELRPRYGLGPDDLVLGFIGTFGPWHGIPALAEALPGLMAIDPRIRVLLIGDGALRGLVEEAADRAGVRNRLVVTGVVPQERAPAYLAMCDIYLSPHQTLKTDNRPFFGSPTKLLEYMSMERPTVASELGQIGETMQPALRSDDLASVADDTDAVGVLVAPGDAADLTRAVAGLVARPALGARLSANARRHVLERYTWTSHVERILTRLDEIVGGSGPDVYSPAMQDQPQTLP